MDLKSILAESSYCPIENWNNKKKIPDFPKSKKLTLGDKEVIKKYAQAFPPYSDFNFTALYCFNLNDKVEVSFLNNNLVVLFQDYLSNELYYSFLGINKVKETMTTLFNHAKKLGIKSQLRLIPEFIVEAISNRNGYAITEDPDNYDYILSVDALCSYEGEKFRQKRSSTNKFKATYKNIETKNLDLKLPEVKKQISLFCDTLDLKDKGSVSQIKEMQSLERLLAKSSSLEINCFAVFVEQKLASFIIYEPFNDKFVIGHFEKSDLNYSGISSYLIQEFSKEISKNGLKYFNYEEDLGIEGLKTKKQRYRPVNFLKKYSIAAAL